MFSFDCALVDFMHKQEFPFLCNKQKPSLILNQILKEVIVVDLRLKLGEYHSDDILTFRPNTCDQKYLMDHRDVYQSYLTLQPPEVINT